MEVIDLELEGLKLIKPKVFRDERGFFLESYQRKRYQENGIECLFIQDNFAFSRQNTIRGLHYQISPGQSKLVSVSNGSILDVVVDIRPQSKTFGKYCSVILDDESFHQLFIPHGFAHGYCVNSANARVHYKVDNLYNPQAERGFRWNDPDLKIEWPVKNPVLSLKDRLSPSFASMNFAEIAL